MEQTLTRTNTEVALLYLECLRTGNAAGFPIADDLAFEDPLTNGPKKGKAAFLEFVRPMPSLIRSIQVRKTWTDENTVVVQWDADTVAGIIPVIEVFTIREGTIAEARAWFDPRPLTNPS